MRLLLSIILVMFLSGCCSTKVENTVNELFLEKYLPRLENYIMNDQSLTIRDKNTFMVEYNVYLNSITSKKINSF